MDFLQHEGCEKVGFEKSIWKVTVTIDGHHILLGVHIDEFVIAVACANFQSSTLFANGYSRHFNRTCKGSLEHYLGCKIARDLVAGATQISQTQYAEEVSYTFGFWDTSPRTTTMLTPMKPNTRVSNNDCDPSPKI